MRRRMRRLVSNIHNHLKLIFNISNFQEAVADTPLPHLSHVRIRVSIFWQLETQNIMIHIAYRERVDGNNSEIMRFTTKFTGVDS